MGANGHEVVERQTTGLKPAHAIEASMEKFGTRDRELEHAKKGLKRPCAKKCLLLFVLRNENPPQLLSPPPTAIFVSCGFS